MTLSGGSLFSVTDYKRVSHILFPTSFSLDGLPSPPIHWETAAGVIFSRAQTDRLFTERNAYKEPTDGTDPER